MGENGVIGNKGKLPWDMPADMRHFRSCTVGRPVVMGSKTFASIGHPLSERKNIILTRNKAYIAAHGCLVMYSPHEIMEKYKEEQELMVIGGAGIYETFLPYAHYMYLTYIKHVFEGDVYFPSFNEDEWSEISREDHEADKENPYPYAFITRKRKCI